MAERILVGTRKGTFIVDKSDGRWRPALVGHAGAGVNYVARDPSTGTLWALLGHGHWGAKLSRSRDDGKTWEDAAQVRYPDGARYIGMDFDEQGNPKEGAVRPATLLKLWVIGFCRSGRIYVGTIPGGLFVSSDGGETFELNRPLWNHGSRGGDLFADEPTSKNHWFGTPASEGEFAPGIHSIVVDPRDRTACWSRSRPPACSEHRRWESWHGRNKGLRNDYLPDPEAEWGTTLTTPAVPRATGPHLAAEHCGVFYSSTARPPGSR